MRGDYLDNTDMPAWLLNEATDGDEKGTSTDAGSDDELAQTGADTSLPVGIAAGTLLLVGAGIALKARRQTAAE